MDADGMTDGVSQETNLHLCPFCLSLGEGALSIKQAPSCWSPSCHVAQHDHSFGCLLCPCQPCREPACSWSVSRFTPRLEDGLQQSWVGRAHCLICCWSCTRCFFICRYSCCMVKKVSTSTCVVRAVGSGPDGRLMGELHAQSAPPALQTSQVSSWSCSAMLVLSWPGTGRCPRAFLHTLRCRVQPLKPDEPSGLSARLLCHDAR